MFAAALFRTRANVSHAAIAISGGEFESISELAARDATLEEVFGAPELNVERRFRIEREDQIFDVTLLKRELDIPAFAVELFVHTMT